MLLHSALPNLQLQSCSRYVLSSPLCAGPQDFFLGSNVRRNLFLLVPAISASEISEGKLDDAAWLLNLFLLSLCGWRLELSPLCLPVAQFFCNLMFASAFEYFIHASRIWFSKLLSKPTLHVLRHSHEKECMGLSKRGLTNFDEIGEFFYVFVERAYHLQRHEFQLSSELFVTRYKLPDHGCLQPCMRNRLLVTVV